mmetsp:Transcript_8072/g.22928  ORF Transcript_8072/g.22928 Transcript_8072/m.22928 type:complete len:212 (-) Transcript_8072:1975-2610(-)
MQQRMERLASKARRAAHPACWSFLPPSLPPSSLNKMNECTCGQPAGPLSSCEGGDDLGGRPPDEHHTLQISTQHLDKLHVSERTVVLRHVRQVCHHQIRTQRTRSECGVEGLGGVQHRLVRLAHALEFFPLHGKRDREELRPPPLLDERVAQPPRALLAAAATLGAAVVERGVFGGLAAPHIAPRRTPPDLWLRLLLWLWLGGYGGPLGCG